MSKKQAIHEWVDAQWARLESALCSLGFKPDPLSGFFIRGEGAETLRIKPSFDLNGNMYCLDVRGNPDRIIAMLTPPGGDTRADD